MSKKWEQTQDPAARLTTNCQGTDSDPQFPIHVIMDSIAPSKAKWASVSTTLDQNNRRL